jgi:hypothetical protein
MDINQCWVADMGPEKAAFDGTWKPGDFEELKSVSVK